MRKSLLAFAAATALATIASIAVPTKADAQVFVYDGARYCFYFDGWHGAGWYRCGYRLRTGLGWGGEYGFRGWRHSGWERRGHRHGGGDVNIRIRSGDGRDGRDGNRSGMRRGGDNDGNRSGMRRGGNDGGNRSGMQNSGGQMRMGTGGNSGGGRSGMSGGGNRQGAGPSGGGRSGGNKPSGGGTNNRP